MSKTTSLLVYVSNLTPRINYSFKQVCTQILGIKVEFTSKIEEFIAFEGAKLSYGKQKMGNEFFVKQSGLLEEQGYSDLEVKVVEWEDTVCFFRVSKQSDLPFDIFSASFYLLSRYEEYLPHVKDEYDRFPYQESLAYKNEFIDIPVVDIWALKFFEILQEKFPQLERKEKKLANKNILAVAEAYKYKKKGIVRNIGSALRALLKLQVSKIIERLEVILYITKDPFDVYEKLIEISKQENISWDVMFQLSNYSIKCKNISYNKISYHALIKSMGDYGKIGLLAGYEALNSILNLKTEKRRWENIVNRPLEITLSPCFDINLPTFYNNCDKLEIKEDYSMGYTQMPGFRASTCTPYLFYDINFERISPLRITPYAFNSLTFQRLSFFEARKRLETIKNNVAEVNGTLSVVFQNADFEEAKEEKTWELIKMLNRDPE